MDRLLLALGPCSLLPRAIARLPGVNTATASAMRDLFLPKLRRPPLSMRFGQHATPAAHPQALTSAAEWTKDPF